MLKPSFSTSCHCIVKIKLSLKKTPNTTNALESLLLEKILKSPFYNENKILFKETGVSSKPIFLMRKQEKEKNESANGFDTKHTMTL